MSIQILSVKDALAVAGEKQIIIIDNMAEVRTGEDITEELNQVIELSPSQFKKALYLSGLTNSVESILNSPGQELLKIDFENRFSYHSDHPDILAVGATLGKTADQIYQIFKLGSIQS